MNKDLREVTELACHARIWRKRIAGRVTANGKDLRLECVWHVWRRVKRLCFSYSKKIFLFLFLYQRSVRVKRSSCSKNRRKLMSLGNNENSWVKCISPEKNLSLTQLWNKTVATMTNAEKILEEKFNDQKIGLLFNRLCFYLFIVWFCCNVLSGKFSHSSKPFIGSSL